MDSLWQVHVFHVAPTWQILCTQVYLQNSQAQLDVPDVHVVRRRPTDDHAAMCGISLGTVHWTLQNFTPYEGAPGLMVKCQKLYKTCQYNLKRKWMNFQSIDGLRLSNFQGKPAIHFHLSTPLFAPCQRTWQASPKHNEPTWSFA